jgi:non-ribosomal peptide synthetase component F
MSGREQHALLQKIIGFFVTSVVFKMQVDHDKHFEDFLRQVHQDFMETFQHQGYPLELVCDDLKTRYPDIPVCFNMLNIQDKTDTLDMDTFKAYHIPDAHDVKFDIEPYVTEYKNGIDIFWSYRKSMFKPTTIEFMIKEYIKILDFFSHHPNKNYKAFKLTKRKETIWEA